MVGPVMDTADAQLVASVKLAISIVTHPVPVEQLPDYLRRLVVKHGVDDMVPFNDGSAPLADLTADEQYSADQDEREANPAPCAPPRPAPDWLSRLAGDSRQSGQDDQPPGG